MNYTLSIIEFAVNANKRKKVQYYRKRNDYMKIRRKFEYKNKDPEDRKKRSRFSISSWNFYNWVEYILLPLSIDKRKMCSSWSL